MYQRQREMNPSSPTAAKASVRKPVCSAHQFRYPLNHLPLSSPLLLWRTAFRDPAGIRFFTPTHMGRHMPFTEVAASMDLSIAVGYMRLSTDIISAFRLFTELFGTSRQPDSPSY